MTHVGGRTSNSTNGTSGSNNEKEATLVVRQSRWSPSPETVLEDAKRDPKIVNLNLLGISLTTSVLKALTSTLTGRSDEGAWNQVHIHQCHTMDLDCSELARALTTHVKSLVLSGSSELLNAILLLEKPTGSNSSTTTTTSTTTRMQKFTINQPRTGLKETQCLQLGRFLAFCTTLQDLSLKGTALQAPGLLAPGLSTAKSLKRVILSDTGLLDQGRADLVVCLNHQYGIGAVHRLLQYSNLKALDLSNLHLQDGHAAKLFQALAEQQPNCTLEQLNLSFNDITCNGMVALSRYIPQLQHLSKVSFKPNPWGSRGAAALVTALEQNVSIQYLDSLLLIRQAPLLRYYTALNRGGRRILHSNENQVPLGLWPLILERAWKISYEPASYFDDDPKAKFHAIYYLLRNGNFLTAG